MTSLNLRGLEDVSVWFSRSNLSYKCGINCACTCMRQIYGTLYGNSRSALVLVWPLGVPSDIHLCRLPSSAANMFAWAVALWRRRYHLRFRLKIFLFFLVACVYQSSHIYVQASNFVNAGLSIYSYIYIFFCTVSIFLISSCNISVLVLTRHTTKFNVLLHLPFSPCISYVFFNLLLSETLHRHLVL